MSWLINYRYRKSITISRSSGAVTNYQMKLLIGESSGATGESVDCGGKCLSTFNDLRFTTSDGTTLLDYWIESITGTTPNQLATVWIEFNSIGTDDTTFYMYYGNTEASSYSNGADTFILFDDFERGLDGDAIGGFWNPVVGNQDYAYISTAQKYNGLRSGRFQHNKNIYTINITGSELRSVMWWAYKNDGAAVTMAHGDANTGSYIKWDIDEKIYYYNGSVWVDSTGVASHSTWHKFELNNYNYTSKTNDIWIDDVKKVIGAAHAVISNMQNKFLFEGRIDGYDQYIDCLCVRNWRATEPSWGTWGIEEQSIKYQILVCM